MKSRVDVICPIYNAEKYILNLDKSIKKQKNIDDLTITYILTESNDDTEKIMINNNIPFKKIKKGDFSHSLTREREAMTKNKDIIVFVTQDAEITDDLWLYNLIKPILEKEADATYSRQITKYNNIEKYTREKNYPDYSFIKSKRNIKDWGLSTFFYSNVSSAVKKDVFVKLKGFDGKKLSISEDMYFAYKLITRGYKIKYCSDSIVYHSHDFSLKELYNRYLLTGIFFRENSYLDKYGTTNSGYKLGIYILKRIIKEHRFCLLFRYPFDMAARFIGLTVGKKRGR